MARLWYKGARLGYNYRSVSIILFNIYFFFIQIFRLYKFLGYTIYLG